MLPRRKLHLNNIKKHNNGQQKSYTTVDDSNNNNNNITCWVQQLSLHPQVDGQKGTVR